MTQIEADIFSEFQISLFSDSNNTQTRYKNKDLGPSGQLLKDNRHTESNQAIG